MFEAALEEEEEEQEEEEEKEQRKPPTSGKTRVRVRSAPSPSKKMFVPTKLEPFQMTLREEERRHDMELALSVLPPGPKKPGQEQEQFHAIPLPKHIKERRYERIVEESEKRKARAKEEATERMQKSMRPFSFVVREEEKMKRLQRSNSSPNLGPAKPYFEASPFPAAIFTDYAEEQRKERDNYRSIQRKLRQDLLLSKAAFPPRMESEMIRFTEI